MSDSDDKIEEFEEPTDEELKPDFSFVSPLSQLESEPISEPVASEPLKKQTARDLYPDPPEVYEDPDEHDERVRTQKPLDRVEIQKIIDQTGKNMVPEHEMRALAESASKSPNARLRIEAALLYMTDPDKGSIAKLREDPRFASLSETTLISWRQKDGWAEKRKRFLGYWAANAYKKIGSRLAQERKHDLDMLTRARDLAMEKLEDPDVQPKSFEGVLTALIKASERIQNIQESITADMMPPSEEEEEESPLIAGPTHHQLSDAEMESLVSGLLEQRREAIREEQGVDAKRADRQAIAEQNALQQESLSPMPENMPPEPTIPKVLDPLPFETDDSARNPSDLMVPPKIVE